MLGRQAHFPAAETPAESYTQTQQEFQTSLDFRHSFLRFNGSEKSLEVGQWWLVDDSQAAAPLADRVEMAVVKSLMEHPGRSTAQIETDCQSQFSGVLLPDETLICECLKSYGENFEGSWHLKDQDTPAIRREDIALMGKTVSGLGEKLGFATESQSSEIHRCVWMDKNGAARYVFYFSASAFLGKFLIEENPAPAGGVIVIPGGRANLVMFKLRHDPRLQKIFDQGWRFLKYRQIRQLANSPTLTAENLETHLGFDPLTYTETQMRMF